MAAAPAGYTAVTLASGTSPLTAGGVGNELNRLESALPEQSLMQLSLQVRPVLGQDLAAAIAAAFNDAVASGRLLGAHPAPPRWPGAATWATGSNGQVTIRWIKGQPQILVVIGVLALLVVAGIVILGLITHWQFLRWIPRPGPSGGPDWTLLIIGGVVIVGVLDCLLGGHHPP
jgi:hypothetical protein